MDPVQTTWCAQRSYEKGEDNLERKMPWLGQVYITHGHRGSYLCQVVGYDRAVGCRGAYPSKSWGEVCMCVSAPLEDRVWAVCVRLERQPIEIEIPITLSRPSR